MPRLWFATLFFTSDLFAIHSFQVNFKQVCKCVPNFGLILQMTPIEFIHLEL